MQTHQDYSSYHLHELESALANMDQSANPEEARIIRQFIEGGGYSYPTEPKVAGVRFVNSFYKRALIAALATLVAMNACSLVLGHRIFALVPLTLQATTLLMIVKNHEHTCSLIKIWSALLVVSGLSWILSMYYAPEVNWLKLLGHLLTLAGGIGFFALSNRYVEPEFVGSNKSLNTDAPKDGAPVS